MDYKTFKWANLSDRKAGQLNCPEVTHWDGDFFFMCGGYNKSADVTSAVTQIIDSKTLQTFDLPSMNVPRASHKLLKISKHEVLCTGGETDGQEVVSSVEIYSFKKRAWSLLPKELPLTIMNHSQVMFDDWVYIFGGWVNDDINVRSFSIMRSKLPNLDKWETF